MIKIAQRTPFMRGSRKFCQIGSNFDVCSLVDEVTSGPSLAFRWRADDDTTLNAGLVVEFVICKRIRPSIARKPYIL